MKDTPDEAVSPVNRLVLAAQLAEVTPMRYSPAGVPVLDCVLAHASQVLEAGSVRQVSAHIKAVAVGLVAEQIAKQPLGMQAVFEGFVATAAAQRQKGASPSTRLAFHIQSFTLGPSASSAPIPLS